MRDDAAHAVVRAELVGEEGGSPTLVEAELVTGGRSRTFVNRKPSRTRRDTAAAAPCTVFSPEDLALVAGGPKGRRDLLDDALALLDAEGARAADDLERVLRQRAALLRQVGGRPNPGPEILTTLDVWDQRLADAAKILVAAAKASPPRSHPGSPPPTGAWPAFPSTGRRRSEPPGPSSR